MRQMDQRPQDFLTSIERSGITEAIATAGLNHHAEAPPGPPMTRGSAAAAQVRLIVLCKARQHQVESDPAGGCEVRRRNVRARLALATGLFAVWEPAG